MKRSIIVAFLILAGVVGWLGLGQITNVNAQDDTASSNEPNSETVEKNSIEDTGT